MRKRVMTEKIYMKPVMRVLMTEPESEILGESVFNPELQEEEAGESWARDGVNYDIWEK
jgi:hypothetical protein